MNFTTDGLATTQVRLSFRAVWSDYSLGTLRKARCVFHHTAKTAAEVQADLSQPDARIPPYSENGCGSASWSESARRVFHHTAKTGAEVQANLSQPDAYSTIQRKRVQADLSPRLVAHVIRCVFSCYGNWFRSLYMPGHSSSYKWHERRLIRLCAVRCIDI